MALLVRATTRAAVNAGKPGQRDAEKIKRRNRSIGECKACRSDHFIAAWACSDPLVAVDDSTAAVKAPKKFHIFHNWHFWKSPSLIERCFPAEHSVIAASYPKQKA